MFVLRDVRASDESDGLTNRRKAFWRCAVWAQTRLYAGKKREREGEAHVFFFFFHVYLEADALENSRDGSTDILVEERTLAPSFRVLIKTSEWWCQLR